MNQKHNRYHEPPFTRQILEYAEVAENGNLVDLYGGVASYGVALLSEYPKLRYWYFDIDDEALDTAKERLERFGARAKIKRINARDLDRRMTEEGLSEIDCAIYDPGLRRGHVENPQRGFLTKYPGPLDGRYDRAHGVTISEIVNTESVEVLSDILNLVGMPFSFRLARAIVESRAETPISSTRELSEIVSKAFPFRARRKRVPPEVLVMLALRIHVNDEFEALREAVRKGFKALRTGGRLVTISYHSGEARIYKVFARQHDERYADENEKKLRVLTRKALKPSDDEIAQNPLIRSAQLRVYEKLKI